MLHHVLFTVLRWIIRHRSQVALLGVISLFLFIRHKVPHHTFLTKELPESFWPTPWKLGE